MTQEEGSAEKSNIFEQGEYLNPKYQSLDKYVNIMYKGFWTPAKYEKLIKEQDVPYYFNILGEADQETIKRCILAVALVEDKVKVYWPSLHADLPQTVIGDIGGLFGMSETTHRRSYHSLLENLKIDPKEIYDYAATKGRIEYLTKYLETDPKIIGKKRILKKLVLFTTLVERVSLFTQFYILMSYSRANKGLKTISSLQQSTATEEIIHYTCGIELINIIKDELPQLWDDYLVELVEKNIKASYRAEKKLIGWFFEKGVPDHLTEEEVLNFLNYNMSVISKDLGLDINFKYDKDMYEEKNKWMMEKISTGGEPDFFDTPAGGYSSLEEDINVEDFEF
ncbi:ribonucleotide-diphosphate reductase subunit beta [bacterium]|nr:ribonucleotide-diphosphate reductase subunit beta [bacterium]